MNNKVTMLMMIDGFGINNNEAGNAIKLAKTPNIDKLMKRYPTTQIEASGVSVGLPEGQIGNWETGHANVEAGRVVYQDLTRITKSIEDGDFFSNPEFIAAIENCKKHNSKLHLMGLLSNGGIHSHLRHLYALLEFAKRRDFEDVFIHCFLDGRDTAPASAEGFIADLQEVIKKKRIGKIASISGRYYSMDRDKKWDRTKKVYDALVCGKGKCVREAIPAIEQSYQKEVFDEFVEPIIITNPEGVVTKIENNDSVILFNFRPDRATQITRALVDPKFDEFKTNKMSLYFVCFSKLEDIPNVHVAFEKEKLKNTLNDVLENVGLNRLRIVENGATYDLKPEKSAIEVTNKAIDAVNSEKYNFIVVDYSELDIMGHTGDLHAAIKAAEIIDKCVGKVVKELGNKGGILLISADHGNCEQMIDYKTGEPHTSHTINPVPLILVTEKKTFKLKSGKLADLTPTILELMEIEKPEEMTGESLLEDNKGS